MTAEIQSHTSPPPNERRSSISNKTFEDTKNARVLIVDDNVDLLRLISIRLKPMQFDLKTVESAEEALSTLALWRPDLIVTDLQMPGMSGMELFKQVQASDALLPFIILTAHGTIPDAVDATQSGVSSYLTKPFDSEALVTQIQIALKSSGFQPENRNQPTPLITPCSRWRQEIITKSPIMEALLDQTMQLAKSNALLAFVGEPGTGKDKLARAAHACSNRADKPLIHLAFISIPRDLLEIEIFGRIGNGTFEEPEQMSLLRQAHQGTFLLNDYSEVPTRILHKLLNALIDGKAYEVDSDRPYPVDVRALITTTKFETDTLEDSSTLDIAASLGYTELVVPPLRERREDIPLLIQHTVSKHTTKKQVQFSTKGMQHLLAADWPGNVRHLISVITQCVRLSKTKIISEAMIQSRLSSDNYEIETLSTAHRNFERNYLVEVLKVTNGNVTKAAGLAKRNRTEFHRLLKKHKIEAKSFRQ